MTVFAVAVMLLGAGRAMGMTSDGTMITNSAAATAYWGPTGPTYTWAQHFGISYNATTQVYVSCPVISIVKTVTPTTIAVAQTATFTICAVNASLSASAWNVTITDRLPDWLAYTTAGFSTWAPLGNNWYWACSGNGTTWTGPANAQPGNLQGAPYFMRWVISPLGPGRSACVTFTGTVL